MLALAVLKLRLVYLGTFSIQGRDLNRMYRGQLQSDLSTPGANVESAVAVGAVFQSGGHTIVGV